MANPDVDPELAIDPLVATNPTAKQRVHASALAKGGRGVLLRGPSGVGKSDTALRLIDRGFQLVGDDQIWLSRTKKGLCAAPDPRLAGTLEVRGMGLWSVPYVAQTPIMLVVDLIVPPYHQGVHTVAPSGQSRKEQTPSQQMPRSVAFESAHESDRHNAHHGRQIIPRLPQVTRADLLGVSVPYVQIYAFEDSSLIKIEWALAQPEKIGCDQLSALPDL